MSKKLVLGGVFFMMLCIFFGNAQTAFAIEQKMDYRMQEKIDKAITALESKEGNVSRQAKKDLISWGQDSVEPLLTVVKNWEKAPADLRVLCVDILGEIKDKRAVPVIISVLSENRMTMRYTAARALGNIGDNNAVPALIKLLKDPEWAVRLDTVEALGKIGDAQAAKPLANVLLTDSHEKVRFAAIEALDKIGGKTECKAVVSALSDPDVNIRGYAVELSASWDIKDSEPIITRMLKDDRDHTVRASCAHALGIYGNMAGVPALIDAIGDGYKDVKIHAMESLKKISGQNYKDDKQAWEHWFELNKGNK